jgi:hypothetical protein
MGQGMVADLPRWLQTAPEGIGIKPKKLYYYVVRINHIFPAIYSLVQMAGNQEPAIFRFPTDERRVCRPLLALSDTSVVVGILRTARSTSAPVLTGRFRHVIS